MSSARAADDCDVHVESSTVDAYVKGLRIESVEMHRFRTGEGTQISRLANGELLGLRINITGTISNVNPEGALWKLNG